MEIKMVLRTLLVIMLTNNAASGQDKTIKLEFNPEKLSTRSLPFNQVAIVDGRIDTAMFYIYQNGTYPYRQVKFEGGLIPSITAYIDSAVEGLKTEDRKVLIKVNSCRVLNLPFIVRKEGHGAFGIGSDSHSRIHFDADVFEYTDSARLRPVFTYSRLLYMYNDTIHFTKFVSRMLDDFLAGISEAYNTSDGLVEKKDEKLSTANTKYKFWRDTTTVLLSRILEVSKRDSIVSNFVSNCCTGNGTFRTFDDLLSGNADRKDSLVRESVKDGVYAFYVVNGKSKKRVKSWAISFDGACYQYYSGTYLKLEVLKNEIRVYVPKSVPDIYSVLSQDLLYRTYKISNMTISGFLPFDIVAYLAIDAIGSKQYNKKTEELYNKGLQMNYRYCIVDPLNGDILFYDRDWVH